MATRNVSNQDQVYLNTQGMPLKEVTNVTNVTNVTDGKVQEVTAQFKLGKRRSDGETSPSKRAKQDDTTLGVTLAERYARDVYGDAFKTIKITIGKGGMCAVSRGPQEVKIVELKAITLELESVDGLHNTRENIVTHHFDSQTPDQISLVLKPLIDDAISSIIEEA